MASKSVGSPHSVSEEARDAFLPLLPTIQRIARFEFRHAPWSYRGELVEDVVALAFTMYAALVKAGRQCLAYPTALAKYAAKQVRSGRRVGCRQSTQDVLSRHAQRRRGFDVVTISGATDRASWLDLADSRLASPAEIATCRLHFADWLEQLSPALRQVASQLALGYGTSELAKLVGVTPARISQLRRLLERDWHDFELGCMA